MKMYWYNFVNEDYEFIETPEDFTDYLPQIPPAQSLYILYQETGDTPPVAAIKVLKLCVGVKE